MSESVADPGKIEQTCAVCSDTVLEPSDCHNTSQCPHGQVCSQRMIFTNGKLGYKLGCEKKTVCDQNKKKSGTVGKRSQDEIEVCNACCEGHNCNQDYCQNIRRNQICYDHAVCEQQNG